MRIVVLTATFIISLLSLGCKRKEGPQGPPGPAGQDLTRPKRGFIQGVARGRDNDGRDFTIPFYYSFEPYPGYRTRIDNYTERFSFYREDSLGIGYVSISFKYDRSTRSITDLQIYGEAADIDARDFIPTYTFSGYYMNVTGDEISDLVIGEDSISGKFKVVMQASPPNNLYPDIVSGSFGVRLLRTREYNRMAGQ